MTRRTRSTGFDVEYAKEIAEMLGVKLKIVPVGSPDRMPFVPPASVDFVMGGMTRNAERAKVIDFTVPVHTEGLSVLHDRGHKPSRAGRISTSR